MDIGFVLMSVLEDELGFELDIFLDYECKILIFIDVVEFVFEIIIELSRWDCLFENIMDLKEL